MKTIGVWNTAFLGDAVLTLPLLRALHAAWPGAAIDFYVRGGLDALFTAQPELRRVYAYDKSGGVRGVGGILSMGRAIASRRYDLWIDAHLSLRSSLIARMSRAPRRVGYAEASLPWLFTDRVERRFWQRAEIERLLALTDVLPDALPGALPLPPSLDDSPSLCWPELVLPLSAQAEAETLIASLPPGPLLGIHPGSVWPSKRWPEEGFAHIARRALECGANVLIFASDAEKESAARVRALAEAEVPPPARAFARAHILDLAGKTSLPVLAALLGRLQCYVTNDSGPMHLAWAQRVPVAALFGPTVEALGFFPRGEHSRVFQTDEPCRPCGLHGHKQCPQKHFRCMRGIDPGEVWQYVHHKLYPWKEQAGRRAALLPG